jgi:hypothetical protein
MFQNFPSSVVIHNVQGEHCHCACVVTANSFTICL